jgi:hypothetical protein
MEALLAACGASEYLPNFEREGFGHRTTASDLAALRLSCAHGPAPHTHLPHLLPLPPTAVALTSCWRALTAGRMTSSQAWAS